MSAKLYLSVITVFFIQSAHANITSLFVETKHDFGEVAMGAKAEHVFILKNTTRETIHLKSIRSSCGCTEPKIIKDTALPGESAAVLARFNTSHFAGRRGATLTVIVDKPQYEEVRLEIRGFIRTDVMFSPGEISFGSVPMGTARDVNVDITYAGRNRNWEIKNVQTGKDFLTAQAILLERTSGQVSYRLQVHLAETAPVGYLNGVIYLTTNDPSSEKLEISLQGRVAAPLAVSPSFLSLGLIKRGDVVKKSIVLKAEKPFRVLEILSDEPGFFFTLSKDPKKIHIVAYRFEAGETARLLKGSLKIRTDLDSMRETFVQLTGQVAE